MDVLEVFEFFEIILENSFSSQRLPDKFAKLLDGREPREVKLREAGSGRGSLWDVVVVFDADGHMYLERGRKQFVCAHDLRLGHLLVFSYDGDAVLTVKVFDLSMCRRHYQYEDDTSSGSSSDSSSDSTSSRSAEMDVDDAPTSQFAVTLSVCHFLGKQQQYLNVPLEFHEAHGYAKRSKVVLRMRGMDWAVNLKHNKRAGGKTRSTFRYGWHQFLVDNRLKVGDICFFRALRGNNAGRGGDDGDDHELKVQVRKLDGSFVD